MMSDLSNTTSPTVRATSSSVPRVPGLVLALALTIPALGPAPADGQEPRPGENVRISEAEPGRAHYEVRVAAHPSDPDAMLAAGMVWDDSAERYDVLAYRTSDGGASWTRSLEVDGMTSDPTLAFGPDGWAYLTEIGSGEEQVHRSPDGGRSWVDPIVVSTGDRPFLAVSGAGTEHAGRLYVHASSRTEPLKGGRGEKAVRVVRADDHGSELLPSRTLHAEEGRYVLGNGPSTVLSDGTLVLLYPERLDGSEIGFHEGATQEDPRVGDEANARLRALVSPDGGESFRPAVTVGDWFHRFGRGRTATVPALAADTSDGPFRDRVYAAWTDFRSGEGRILLSHSEDRGRSWSEPVVVNRDGGPAFRPMLAVNRDGVLGVSWYDRRSSESGLGWDVRFAASIDGGETFGPAARVSGEPFRYGWEGGLMTVGQGGGGEERHSADVSLHGFNDMGGHTAGMAADASGRFHPVWVDNRTGVPQMWTAPVEVDARAVRHGDPALSNLRDLTSKTKLRVERTGYRGAPGTVTLRVRLANTSEDTIRGPAFLRVLDLWSEYGEVEIQDARNGREGPGAVIPLTEALPAGGLEPGGAAAPVEISARVDATEELGPMDPPPPGRRTGPGYGLLNLDLEVLGRVQGGGDR
jgi:hypothetical protein